VAPLIEQGLLVRPLPQSVTTDQPMYIVASKARPLRADVMHLRDWLMAEANSDRS
jgi:DNA-binding transcriptional LysR family regulator